MAADEPTYRVAVSSYALDAKIPPGDPFWRAFNASFVNRNLTRLDLVEAIYTGHPITTWHHNHWRAGANFECGQAIGLDFDTEDDRSRLPTLSADKFIAKHCALLHTTRSHTPDKPRARVMFLLDTPIFQAANYALAAQALLWLFGSADRQCKDPVRFWYGAPHCEVEWYENVLPLGTVKHLIAQYQETGKRERTRHTGEWHTTADQDEVADALRLIPPWQVDYDEWVQVLMGIHAGFGDAGLGLAETWADGAPNEVARKWASFKANGNYAGAVTVATVFGIAKRFGWRQHELV
jgi:hypothetical protein